MILSRGYGLNQTHEKKVDVLKAITEAARKYANKNTGIVRFENEVILLMVENE